MTFLDLIKNFFTHKDFLPNASEIPRTLFTPLHFIVSAIFGALFVFIAYKLVKSHERTMKITLTALWAAVVLLEVIKIFWEIFAGREVYVFYQGILPLYPCSMYMFFFPLCLWAK